MKSDLSSAFVNVSGHEYLHFGGIHMEIVILLLIVGAGGLTLWGLVALARGILQALAAPTGGAAQNNNAVSDDLDGMNNGDYYNGPHGYSPMTGYPETQYGAELRFTWHSFSSTNPLTSKNKIKSTKTVSDTDSAPGYPTASKLYS